MNNLKLGQRVIAALGVAMGLLSSSAPSAVLQLEVTYTNGVVDFGPTCGMPALPNCAPSTRKKRCSGAQDRGQIGIGTDGGVPFLAGARGPSRGGR